MRTTAVVPWDVLGEPPWARPEGASSDSPPERCETLVVGAGVTGLSAALALASSGHEVVVVDRAFGGGAAVRSGGIIVGDTVVGPAPGFDGCDLELRDWLRANAPSCPIRWTGCLELDRNPALAPTPIDWQDAGPVRVMNTIDGGTIDPSALLTALARAATARGARIFTGVAIDRIERDETSVVAFAAGDALRARTLLMMVDATSVPDAGDPWPTRQLTIALETATVSDAIADAIGWRSRLPFYTNELPLLWGRSMDDGAMVAGRELVPMANHDRASLAAAIAAAGARLTTRVRGLHPALAPLAIRRIWAGPIARDATGVPSIRRDPTLPDVWWAGGYGGHGLAQAFRLGRTAAFTLNSKLRSSKF